MTMTLIVRCAPAFPPLASGLRGASVSGVGSSTATAQGPEGVGRTMMGSGAVTSFLWDDYSAQARPHHLLSRDVGGAGGVRNSASAPPSAPVCDIDTVTAAESACSNARRICPLHPTERRFHFLPCTGAGRAGGANAPFPTPPPAPVSPSSAETAAEPGCSSGPYRVLPHPAERRSHLLVSVQVRGTGGGFSPRCRPPPARLSVVTYGTATPPAQRPALRVGTLPQAHRRSHLVPSSVRGDTGVVDSKVSMSPPAPLWTFDAGTAATSVRAQGRSTRPLPRTARRSHLLPSVDEGGEGGVDRAPLTPPPARVIGDDTGTAAWLPESAQLSLLQHHTSVRRSHFLVGPEVGGAGGMDLARGTPPPAPRSAFAHGTARLPGQLAASRVGLHRLAHQRSRLFVRTEAGGAVGGSPTSHTPLPAPPRFLDRHTDRRQAQAHPRSACPPVASCGAAVRPFAYHRGGRCWRRAPEAAHAAAAPRSLDRRRDRRRAWLLFRSVSGPAAPGRATVPPFALCFGKRCGWRDSVVSHAPARPRFFSRHADRRRVRSRPGAVRPGRGRTGAL